MFKQKISRKKKEKLNIGRKRNRRDLKKKKRNKGRRKSRYKKEKK